MHWIEIRFEGRVIASVPFSAEPPQESQELAEAKRFVREQRLLRDDQMGQAAFEMVPSKGEDCTGSKVNPHIIRIASQDP